MLNETLMSSLKEAVLTTTGEYEISGFSEIDAAFASYISRIFDLSRVNKITSENTAFNRFCEKPPADRVVLGKFDTLLEFLQAVRRARGRPKQPDVSTDSLPVINVSRGFDVVYSTSDNKRDTSARRKLEEISDASGLPFAVVERSQASLTYTISLLAFEKETLSLMMNTITLYMRFAKGYSFNVPVNIAFTEVGLDCTFTDARDLIWTDMSAPTATDRLFASSITFTLNVDVVRALSVTSAQQRVDVLSSLAGGYGDK